MTGIVAERGDWKHEAPASLRGSQKPERNPGCIPGGDESDPVKNPTLGNRADWPFGVT